MWLCQLIERFFGPSGTKEGFYVPTKILRDFSGDHNQFVRDGTERAS